MAGRPRTRPPKKHESDLQTLFVKRVKEEMGDRGISSITELSGKIGAPPQRTLNAVLNEGVVPGLTVVAGVAAALGVHAWELMAEKAKNQENLTNVRKLPERYPSWTAKLHKDRTNGKTRKRNTG